MKAKLIVPVLASILIFSFIPSSIFADSEDEFDHPYVSGQVIVSFKPGVSQEDIEDFYEDFYEDYDLTEEENFDNDESDDDPEEKLVSTLLDVDSELIRIIRQDPRVEFAELNYILTADIIPNDLQFDQLWGLHNTGQLGGTIDADIDAPETWDATTGSSNIIVGVIDTGIDYTHTDLVANIWTNTNEIAGNGIDDDGNGWIDDIHGINAITGTGDPMDDHSHGTHVAGTIGAKGNNGIGVAGVNWNVSIAACKFLNSAGSGSTADAIKCFNYFNDLKNSGQNVLITSNRL
jgi:subtilisin family serine protease